MNVETAKNFARYWHGRGYEKGETQKFWLTLLERVFDIDEPERLIEFEKPVHIDGQQKFIDGYFARTKVLIEQKSLGVDLAEGVFEQAKRYADALPADEKPSWIITCNFAEFWIYDRTENLFAPAPKIFKLRYLPREFTQLKCFFDPDADPTPPEEKISADAAKIIQNICLAFDKKYRKRKPDFRDALSKFCTRLVFCFYADDAGLFSKKKFVDWLKKIPTKNLRDALKIFFDTLNTPEDKRPENLDDDLKKFPYVNGGLFEEKLDIPPLNENLKLTIERAHIRDGMNLDATGAFVKFSWREISPPIFGAMFESIFSPVTQHEGGMYYTSERNIHKVIDTLFLDDLREKFNAAKHKQLKNRPQALLELQDKIASLNFLDPACGSGNFLTETYLSLRELENEILDELQSLCVKLPDNPVKVSIRQFYGIEIDPFAAAIAQAALWIAENQMIQETESLLATDIKALPLTKYVTIKCANALQTDWKTVVPSVDFIIGNPPFRGARNKSDAQSRDIGKVFDGWKNLGNLDYVTCWYKKSADFIGNTETRCAFISTNSVCQGDSVGALWKKLFDEGVHIDFARRTFKWLSDSENMAHVHCVVVGFSKAPNSKPKKIFDGDNFTVATNINAYLVDGENIFVESRNEPLCDVPKMRFGNQPLDDRNYRFTPDEMERFVRDEPAAAKFFRPWYGAAEFIKGKRRYCLWLGDTPEEVWRKLPLVVERVENVQRYRLTRERVATRKLAATPTRFQVETFPTGKYLAVPQTSSKRRQYIPMDFMDSSNMASEKLLLVPDAQIYHFGVLTSSIHMAWMRATCGRLKSDYSYSIAVVYNNFPWPKPTSSQRRLIERSAQMILDVRAKFPTWTFDKLYNEDTMPDELRDAHVMNDTAVARAYGFEKFLYDEARVVAELMKLYASLS